MINEEIIVSICCTTYNHGKYIAKTLDGLLNQKTNFDFEILIHDDASTDDTADIIKSYVKSNPSQIKPIYQNENQYKKGYPMNIKYNFPRARGEYIAICEGDDLWIDMHKLQKQVDYMKQNPTCTFCFTNGKIKDAKNKKSDKIFIPYLKENKKYFNSESRKYNLGKLALLGFIPTASFFFPKSNLKNLPSFYFNKYPAGDMLLKLHATSLGYAYFMNDITCIYRTNVSGSAMTSWKKHDIKQIIKHNQDNIELIKEIDKFSNYKYSKELNSIKIDFEFNALHALSDKEILNNKRYLNKYKNLDSKSKFKLISSLYLPKTYDLLKKALKK